MTLSEPLPKKLLLERHVAVQFQLTHRPNRAYANYMGKDHKQETAAVKAGIMS